jgi:hypothetical protein
LQKTLIPFFQENAAQQKKDAANFLPVPGSTSGAVSLDPSSIVSWSIIALSVLLGVTLH